MLNVQNNPLLAKVHTAEGAKKHLDRLIYAEIEQHKAAGRVFVQNRITAVIVNTVGSHDGLTAYGKKKAKQLLDYHLPQPAGQKRAAVAKAAGRAASTILAPLYPTPCVLAF